MVRVSCGVQCAAAILFAFNLSICLLGLTIMGFGIYVRVNDNFKTVNELYSVSKTFGDDVFQWVDLAMILTGVFTAVLAAFGCLGAVLHKRTLLYIYGLCLIFIVVVEFAAFITTLVYRKDIWNTFDSGYIEFFENSFTQNSTDAIQIVYDLEREFKCCGVNNFSDYTSHSWSIPPSCYADASMIPSSLYSQGCAYAIADWLWDKLPVIAGILIGVVLIEMFGIVASLVLGVAINHATQLKMYNQI